jgi:hypothetical protein
MGYVRVWPPPPNRAAPSSNPSVVTCPRSRTKVAVQRTSPVVVALPPTVVQRPPTLPSLVPPAWSNKSAEKMNSSPGPGPAAPRSKAACCVSWAKKRSVVTPAALRSGVAPWLQAISVGSARAERKAVIPARLNHGALFRYTGGYAEAKGLSITKSQRPSPWRRRMPEQRPPSATGLPSGSLPSSFQSEHSSAMSPT